MKLQGRYFNGSRPPENPDALSKKAADLGISVGDTGESALIKMQ